MNTKTMDNRWVEVPKLTLWAINRLNKMCEYFAENQLPNGQLKVQPPLGPPNDKNSPSKITKDDENDQEESKSMMDQ